MSVKRIIQKWSGKPKSKKRISMWDHQTSSHFRLGLEILGIKIWRFKLTHQHLCWWFHGGVHWIHESIPLFNRIHDQIISSRCWITDLHNPIREFFFRNKIKQKKYQRSTTVYISNLEFFYFTDGRSKQTEISYLSGQCRKADSRIEVGHSKRLCILLDDEELIRCQYFS